MQKQLTKEEFIEVAKEFGYNVDIDETKCLTIYINNEISSNNLIAWLDSERKRGVCYDICLELTDDICTRDNEKSLCSKEALKNHLKRVEKDILYWKKQYKLRLIKSIGQNE